MPSSPTRSTPHPPSTGLQLPLSSPAPNQAWTSQNVTEFYHPGLRSAQGFRGRGTKSHLLTAAAPHLPASPVALSITYFTAAALGLCISTNATSTFQPQGLCTCRSPSPQASRLLPAHTLVLTVKVPPQRGPPETVLLTFHSFISGRSLCSLPNGSTACDRFGVAGFRQPPRLSNELHGVRAPL